MAVMEPCHSAVRWPLAAILATTLVGCGDSSEPPATRWTDAAAPFTAPVKMRWYTDEQATAGQALYRANCAECHRDDAAGHPDWRRRDAAGRLPPPPLNGSGHTWHHPLSHLRLVVREGGARWEGTMPGFATRLDGKQIDTILAWAQSHWRDEIYAAWLERGGLSK